MDMATRKIADKTLALFEDIFKILEPPKPLTVSTWAAEHRVLSREASAEPGKWNLDRAPYQRIIMDAISDQTWRRIVLMTSAQSGKTEILLNVIGYYSEHDPSPILMVMPTEDMARDFSKDRLETMIRDTKCLSEVYGKVKSRDSSNTILHKKFPGGYVKMIGANSPANLSSRPIRILLMDEVDRYPASAGTEGDPVDLAERRTNNFWNKKIILTSTPTEKGLSRIEKDFNQSTMEEWCVLCPYCEKYTPYIWENLDFEDMMMACDHCGEKLAENEWKERPGMFVVGNPDVTDTRGFHLNEMASPWKSWKDIVKDYRAAVKDMKAGSDEKMRTWVNTSKGEPYEVKGFTVETDEMLARREHYQADLPAGVLVLTAAVDVQDDRFEIEVCGWGKNYESWGVVYDKLFGNLERDEIWNELEEYLLQEFCFEGGNTLNIACTFLDTGGHFTTQAYKWLSRMKRKHRMIFGIKGFDRSEGVPLLHKKSTNNDYHVPIIILGVNAGKEMVVSRLHIAEPGPGYCHFPENVDRGYDQKYMNGLTSEKRIIKTVNGTPRVKWVKKPGVRNEPFDLRNYNTAAIEFLKPDFAVLENKVDRGINYMRQSSPAAKRTYGCVRHGINDAGL